MSARDRPAGVDVRVVSFASLDGWDQDDHAAAFAVFLRSCQATRDRVPALRAGAAAPDGLEATCRQALALVNPDDAAARGFFERHFQPVQIVADGFLTGYYEPEVPGSPVPTADFAAPLRGRPDALVTLAAGETVPGLDSVLQAAVRGADGALGPVPDRGSIIDGARNAVAPPLVWLRDDVEVFLVQVQGSTRVRLPDGSVKRYAYAGRNGYPYTSVGKIILAEGGCHKRN